jgi:Protein of unknown function (DUF1173)
VQFYVDSALIDTEESGQSLESVLHSPQTDLTKLYCACRGLEQRSLVPLFARFPKSRSAHLARKPRTFAFHAKSCKRFEACPATDPSVELAKYCKNSSGAQDIECAVQEYLVVKNKKVSRRPPRSNGKVYASKKESKPQGATLQNLFSLLWKDSGLASVSTNCKEENTREGSYKLSRDPGTVGKHLINTVCDTKVNGQSLSEIAKVVRRDEDITLKEVHEEFTGFCEKLADMEPAERRYIGFIIGEFKRIHPVDENSVVYDAYGEELSYCLVLQGLPQHPIYLSGQAINKVKREILSLYGDAARQVPRHHLMLMVPVYVEGCTFCLAEQADIALIKVDGNWLPFSNVIEMRMNEKLMHGEFDFEVHPNYGLDNQSVYSKAIIHGDDDIKVFLSRDLGETAPGYHESASDSLILTNLGVEGPYFSYDPAGESDFQILEPK